MAERKLTIRMEAETARLQKGMRLASTESKKFGKSLQDGIARHAPAIRATGMAIAGVGVAMTAAVAMAVKSAADFEKSLAMVSTMLDDISMELMPSYAEGLRKMSKEFGESTKTLSKGLYDILSASIAPTKAMDVLAISAKAAAAGLTDTGVAADAITTIINSYGLAAEDAGRVSDILFAIVKRGKTTFAELGPSIGKVAATAAIADVSLEELGASIATITRAGIRTEEAMTAVNGILRAFLKPTDDAAKAAREFGFELNTNTLRTIGLQGVVKLLSTATAEQTAAMFPNIRGLKGIAAAMKDTEGYAKDYDLMLHSLGLTHEAFVKQSDTLAFAIGQLKQEFTAIFTVLGMELIPIIKKDFLPIIRKTVKDIQPLLVSFRELPDPVKKFLMLLGPLLAGLGAFLILLPSMASGLVAIISLFGFMLSPIGLVIGGLALLAAAWLLDIGDMRATSELFFEDWLAGVEILIKTWKDLKEAWTKFFEDWKAGIEIIKDWVIKKFEWTLEKVGDVWLWFTQTLIPMARFWWTKTFEWTLETLGKGWDKFKETIGLAIGHIVHIFKWTLEKAGEAWAWLEDTLWPWIDKWIVGIFEWTLELGGKLLTWLKETLIPWAEKYVGIDKAWDWTINLLGDAWKKLKELWDWLGEIPEKLGLVKEKSEDLGKATDKIVSPKLKKDLSYLKKSLEGTALALKDAEQNWTGFGQIAKQETSAMAAQFILLSKGITDLAGKIPLEFAKKFHENFLRASPDIQRAILDALVSSDIERALSLIGMDWGEILLYGSSPGGLIPTLEEGADDIAEVSKELFSPLESEAIKATENLTEQMDKMMEGILGSLKPMTEKMREAFDKMWGLLPENLKEQLGPIRNAMIAILDSLLLLFGDFGKDIEEETEDVLKDIVEVAAKGGKEVAEALKRNWLVAFRGFTTELWVTFKTIALEKLGLLGDTILAFAQIVRGELIEGAKNLGAVFGEIAGGLLISFLGLITQTDAYKKLVEILQPVIEAAIGILHAFLAPFIPIIEVLANAFLPILEALAPIFGLLGRIIAGLIIPIFKALWPIVKLILVILTYFGQALALAWKWIAKVFGLPGYHAAVDMIEAMKQLRKEIWDMENPFKDLTTAMQVQTKSAQQSASAQRNYQAALISSARQTSQFSDQLKSSSAQLRAFDLGNLITPVNFRNYITGVNLRDFVGGVNLGDFVGGVSLGDYVGGVNLGDFVSSVTIPSYQFGIPSVPETGLAWLHRGERVIREALNRPGPMARITTPGRGGNVTYSFGPIEIAFPSVTSFKDWLEADPMTIKEVFDRKIYLAMRAAAREGTMSKESVMME